MLCKKKLKQIPPSVFLTYTRNENFFKKISLELIIFRTNSYAVAIALEYLN